MLLNNYELLPSDRKVKKIKTVQKIITNEGNNIYVDYAGVINNISEYKLIPSTDQSLLSFVNNNCTPQKQLIQGIIDENMSDLNSNCKEIGFAPSEMMGIFAGIPTSSNASNRIINNEEPPDNGYSSDEGYSGKLDCSLQKLEMMQKKTNSNI